MKNIFLAGTVFLASTLAYGQQTRQSIEQGASIPMADVKMKSASAVKETSLNDAKTNNGLLVMFSCNTCPYVVKSQARTLEMIAYAKEKGLGVVIINSNEAKRSDEDSYSAMVSYAKKQGYTVPYAVDEKSKMADAFGASRTPEVYLFDGNGKLMYKGAMEDNPSSPSESKEFYLKKAIDNMVIGIVPDPASTRSVGCTIKRES